MIDIVYYILLSARCSAVDTAALVNLVPLSYLHQILLIKAGTIQLVPVKYSCQFNRFTNKQFHFQDFLIKNKAIYMYSFIFN